VVVDNQSRDAAALDYLHELESRERVRVLRYDAPFNYSAINNWAARQCDGRVLGLVNNDIEVITPDWLEEMAGFAMRPDTGAVGAMLYYPDETIQHAGVVLGILGVAGHINCRMPRGYEGHGGRGLVVQNLSAVTGACMLVRRTIFDEVGGLDEQLPIAFNDIDFCMRVRARGYRNVWTPFAELYHHESASRGQEDTEEKMARFNAEVAFMQARWGNALLDDPAYNPNLSLQSHSFELAFPPREQGGRGMAGPRTALKL
jgi:GT2 family glycosyltransferase